jgi:hypothetical protein
MNPILSKKIEFINNKIKPGRNSTEFALRLEKGECCVECIILLLPVIAAAFGATLAI